MVTDLTLGEKMIKENTRKEESTKENKKRGRGLEKKNWTRNLKGQKRRRKKIPKIGDKENEWMKQENEKN